MPDSTQRLTDSSNKYTLRFDQLQLAIEHLYKAIELLETAKSKLSEGIVSGAELSSMLAESWLEVNKCRLYTESMLMFEELLVPSLGLINDAKCMLESSIAWHLGLTANGYLNIVNCINLAICEGIRPCLEELETWLSE